MLSAHFDLMMVGNYFPGKSDVRQCERWSKAPKL